MAFPALTASASLRGPTIPSPGRPTPTPGSIEPQTCSMTKKVLCGGAFLACGASCYFGPEVCIPCLAAVGGGADCLNCILDW